jgi:NAD(P)-dependent dehydrogenase (short-subunit alcohol dehydrogenase family)
VSRVAVVTGATRGIGAASAAALGHNGFTVVVTGRSQPDVDAAAHRLTNEGIQARGVVLDVTSPENAVAAAQQIGDEFGHIDVLVNNAGALPEATSQRAEVADPAVVASTFATNILGPFNVVEAFLPLLRKSEAARIVNVSTRMGSLAEQADPSSAYYSMVVPAYQASKAALNSFTISLSKGAGRLPDRGHLSLSRFRANRPHPGQRGSGADHPGTGGAGGGDGGNPADWRYVRHVHRR